MFLIHRHPDYGVKMPLQRRKATLLKKCYLDQILPVYVTGQRSLYQYAREIDRGQVGITLKDVKCFLAIQEIWGKHKTSLKRFIRLKHVCVSVDGGWQADLVDTQKLAKRYNGSSIF